MGMGSFLAGLFLGEICSSNIVHNHNHNIIVRNPIHYPDDYDNYSDEKKLEWLKNRSYWTEYYQLKQSLYNQVKFKLVEGDNICYHVIDSIVRNKGDKTEAEQLFVEYLNKKCKTITKMMIENEIDRMNDYIQRNYSAISQFYKPVEYYYFNKSLVRVQTSLI